MLEEKNLFYMIKRNVFDKLVNILFEFRGGSQRKVLKRLEYCQGEFLESYLENLEKSGRKFQMIWYEPWLLISWKSNFMFIEWQTYEIEAILFKTGYWKSEIHNLGCLQVGPGTQKCLGGTWDLGPQNI